MPSQTELWAGSPTEPWHLTRGCVHLWTGELDRPEEEVADGKAVLTPDELEHAARYRFIQHRSRFIVARSQLRRILGNYLGIEPWEIVLELNRWGKPFIPGKALHFNLSHSHNKYILAVSAEPVGVDIEHFRQDPDLAAIAELVFSSLELQHWKQLGENERTFFQIWTRKEALLKAIGCGITEHCPEVSVLFASDLPQLSHSLSDFKWHLVDLPFNGAILGALATPLSAPELVWRSHFNAQGEPGSSAW